MNKPYGYIEDVVQPQDYTLGALPQTVIQPTGQWLLYLPESEVQEKNGLETYNCTKYGTLNAIEGLMKKKYGIMYNFSERYAGITGGTTKQGASPKDTIEKIRNYTGVIPESDLPFTADIKAWEQYYSGVTFGLKLKGVSWLRDWQVTYEWVLNEKHDDWQARLKEGLKYSPLGIAVHAWHEEGGMFIRTGADTHWCTLVGYVEGKYWIVFDSYDKNIKKLDWNFGFTRAIRYHIDKREVYDAKFVTRALRGVLGLY